MDRSKRVRLFIEEELSLDLDIALSVDQAKYLFKVMRLNVGQVIMVLDGKTGEYEAEIRERGACNGIIRVRKKNMNVRKPADLWLLFAPLKKNRTEWVIEKATELGVRRIIPVITSHTSQKTLRMTRLKSIMIEALEQCGGTFLPDLIEPIALANCLDTWPLNRPLIFCDESLSEQNSLTYEKIDKKNKRAGILVGPEGGFSNLECQFIKQKKTTLSISLGPRILRADTAAVAAISVWKNITSKS